MQTAVCFHYFVCSALSLPAIVNSNRKTETVLEQMLHYMLHAKESYIVLNGSVTTV